MRAQTRKLHTCLGRVVREIGRKIAADEQFQQIFADELEMASRLLAQKKDSATSFTVCMRRRWSASARVRHTSVMSSGSRRALQ